MERTYRMHSGLDDIGRFVIGDRGYRRLYAGDDLVRSVDSPFGARTLVRETGEGVRAAIYLPDELVRTLERFPPQCGLGEENVQPFATLVEELDHLLVLAERARQRRPVSLFELELHANVSKHLVLSRFLAGREPRLSPDRRWWLWHHLFDGVEYTEEEPEVRERYEDATVWAVRLLKSLAERRTDERLEMLRAFHSAGMAQKVAMIRDYTG